MRLAEVGNEAVGERIVLLSGGPEGIFGNLGRLKVILGRLLPGKKEGNYRAVIKFPQPGPCQERYGRTAARRWVEDSGVVHGRYEDDKSIHSRQLIQNIMVYIIMKKIYRLEYE